MQERRTPLPHIRGMRIEGEGSEQETDLATHCYRGVFKIAPLTRTLSPQQCGERDHMAADSRTNGWRQMNRQSRKRESSFLAHFCAPAPRLREETFRGGDGRNAFFDGPSIQAEGESLFVDAGQHLRGYRWQRRQ
ncbi:MAG: hypothetical protein A3J75_08990 [Acidobacteria bacterium RBG_16_68_9]|nr:MAG: hypothetical protein A3J75_08990 [Acidobacteria bacterium RBG_16_68_9]